MPAVASRTDPEAAATAAAPLHLGAAGAALQPVPGAPRLTSSRVPWSHAVTVRDETGTARTLHLPTERALTLYLDREELVTLMTLGAWPELLVLGWLRNQRLVAHAAQIESITVDWEIGAAAARSREEALQSPARQAAGAARRVVTTGCGQGTVFAQVLEELQGITLAPPARSRLGAGQLQAMLEQVRALPSIHRQAGSVHGSALFRGTELLLFVEDVGRHNAVDTLAGWMLMHGLDGAGLVIYTTGRLTSEMVIKAAWCGVPVLVSRNGVTAMGLAMAERLGMTLIGRALNRHHFCYSGFERLDEPHASP